MWERRPVGPLTVVIVPVVLLSVFCLLGSPGKPLLADGGEESGGEAEMAVAVAGSTVMVCRNESSPFKPYVRELFTPAGVQVLLDAPADHLHHHGWMFAMGVEGVNFWEENPAARPGRQVVQSTQALGEAEGDEAGRNGICQQIDWIDADGHCLLKEERTIEVEAELAHGARVLTWRSELQTGDSHKPARLSGTRYHGLGMRFVRTMDRVGQLLRPADHGEVRAHGEERMCTARWSAYAAPAGTSDVTVAMFDDPGNARHPATWFSMQQPFAYLSATLAIDQEPFVLEPGKTLVLCYGTALWDGARDGETIEKVYSEWVARRGRATDRNRGR